LNSHSGRSDYWTGVLHGLDQRGHYLDDFLAKLKRDTYLAIIARWGGTPESGYVLKTDLFEEATGADAFLTELGCGQNRLLGMDISQAVVSRARSRCGIGEISARSQGPTSLWLTADIRELPLAAEKFTLVISPSTLDHFTDTSDLERSLKESARILAPGGRIIVTLDNRQNIFDSLFRFANRLGWLPFTLGRSYAIGELVGALESADLRVQDTAAILHNPRLFAVGAIQLARVIGSRRLTLMTQQLLVAMQRFGETRFRYRTGSFIAALAIKPENPSDHPV
jgi:SAM-dependent methyltransferase